jgi:hypothetical protein
VNSSSFSQVWAEKSGGVIFLSLASQAYLENSSFTENHAIDGGVAYLESNSSIEIFGCLFRLNQALNFGGALFSPDFSKLNVSNSIFQNNTAVSIHIFDSRYLILKNVFFWLNSAIFRDSFSCSDVNGAGGAIFFRVLQQSSISNSSFIENHADWFGGGLAFLQVLNANLTILSLNEFQRNLAKYRLNFGAAVGRLRIWTDKSTVISRENFNIYMKFQDAFNNTASLESCTVTIESIFSDILQIYPSFYELVRDDNISASFQISLRYQFYQSLLNFPRADFSLNLSIQVKISSLEGGTISSNLIPISVQLCPLGYMFWKQIRISSTNAFLAYLEHL